MVIRERKRKAFEGESFRVSLQNKNFKEKTFTNCSDPIIMGVDHKIEKTFMDDSETAKSTKVFSYKVHRATFASNITSSNMLLATCTPYTRQHVTSNMYTIH